MRDSGRSLPLMAPSPAPRYCSEMIVGPSFKFTSSHTWQSVFQLSFWLYILKLCGSLVLKMIIYLQSFLNMSFLVFSRSWQTDPKARALASFVSLRRRKRQKQWRKWTGELLQLNRCMWPWLSAERSVKRSSPINMCSGLLAWGPWRVQSLIHISMLDTTWLYHRYGP